VRPFDRHEADEVDIDPEFGKPHGGRKACETAADDENPRLSHG
jgi:hypothetical protein